MATQSMKLSFGDIQEEKENMNKVPTAGIYSLQVTGWKFQPTRKSDPMVVFTTRIVDDEEFENRVLSLFAPLSSFSWQNAIIYLAEAANLDSPEFTLEELAQGPGAGNDSSDWLDSATQGTVLYGQVTNGDYNGQTVANLNKFVDAQ